MSGIIDISKLKVPPEKHELETARYFAQQGHDIEFIPPSNSPEIHTPDIKMDNLEWEVKSPQGKSDRTIEKSIRQAVKQSHCIIVDLRRIHVPEAKCLIQLEKQFTLKTYIRRMLVIKKNGELVDFSRK